MEALQSEASGLLHCGFTTRDDDAFPEEDINGDAIQTKGAAGT